MVTRSRSSAVTGRSIGRRKCRTDGGLTVSIPMRFGKFPRAFQLKTRTDWGNWEVPDAQASSISETCGRISRAFCSSFAGVRGFPKHSVREDLHGALHTVFSDHGTLWFLPHLAIFPASERSLAGNALLGLAVELQYALPASTAPTLHTKFAFALAQDNARQRRYCNEESVER